MTDRLGRYQIKSQLGQGGFGQVFKAFDPIVGRMVAIKVLHAEADSDVIRRFRNEAAAAGRLRHENIVTIFDFGEENGLPYIVMEYSEGSDLQKLMASGKPKALREKLRILTQIAIALDYAHEHGVIHRDVKPANVMVLPNKAIKVMDFGIAFATNATRSRLTPQGAIIGTLQYMAPEQFLGSEPDARSDIFSYGTMFYHLLSGSHPFGAAEPATMMYNILHAEPSLLNKINGECPDSLNPIALRLLQKDPALRYQSLADVAADCEPILLDLEKAKALHLLAIAEAALAKGQLELAETQINKAFGLDRANKEIRDCRQAIRRQIQRRSVQPQIDSLLAEAKRYASSEDPAAALAKLEAAAALDPDSSQLQSFVGNAREAVERSIQINRLLDSANQALNLGRLEAAYADLEAARNIDGSNKKVVSLLSQVQTAMSDRVRKKQLTDGVDRVKSSLLSGHLSKAEELLVELEAALAGDNRLRELRSAIDRQKDMTRYRDDLAQVRTSISFGRFSDALEALETLTKRFGNTKEVLELAEVVTKGQAEQASERPPSERELLEEAIPVATRQYEVKQLVADLKYDGNNDDSVRPKTARAVLITRWRVAAVAATGLALMGVTIGFALRQKDSYLHPPAAALSSGQPQAKVPSPAIVSSAKVVPPSTEEKASPTLTEAAQPISGKPKRPVDTDQPKPLTGTGSDRAPATVRASTGQREASKSLPNPPETQTDSSDPLAVLTRIMQRQRRLEAGQNASPSAKSSGKRSEPVAAGAAPDGMDANSRGLRLFKLNMFAEAIVNFSEAIAANPVFSEAYLNRGAAYQAIGKYEDAIADYNHALTLRPGFATALAFKADAEKKLSEGVQGTGSGASAPTLINKLEAPYTPEARKAGVKGTVVLACVVDEKGLPTDIKVLTPLGYGLDEAAVLALTKARFHPSQLNGKAVRFALDVKIAFEP